MESSAASAAFSALGHEPRLAVYRLLARAGAAGMAAGDIARATGARPNTLSSNLAILTAAGLITPRRVGRSIIYAVSFDRLGEILAFLVDECCGVLPEFSAPYPQKVAAPSR